MTKSKDILTGLPESILCEAFRVVTQSPIDIDDLAVDVLALISPANTLNRVTITALKENAEARKLAGTTGVKQNTRLAGHFERHGHDAWSTFHSKREWAARVVFLMRSTDQLRNSGR